MEHKKSILVSIVLEKCEVLRNNTMQVYILLPDIFSSQHNIHAIVKIILMP